MPEPTVDRSTVRLLITIIGVLAAIGLGGTLWLLGTGRDASAVAVFAGMTGTLIGALTTLATNRSTTTPAQSAQAVASTPAAPIAPEATPEAGRGQTSGPSDPSAGVDPVASTVAATGPGMLGL